MIRTVSRAGLAVLISASVTLACGFHGYVPEETAVDRLLSSDRVVLARPAADNPFRYEVDTILRGPAEEVDIPFLVNTVARRTLAANPDDKVLFARDAVEGGWQQVAYLDPAMKPVMTEVLERLDEWRLGGDWERFQFFADLLTHPDRDVAELVLGELDRAPYPVLAELNMTPDAEWLLRGIFDEETLGTLPIRVLLLGLSDDPAARAFLLAQFAPDRVPGGPTAGAFAVALIESAGPEGVARVASAVRDGVGGDPVQRERLIEAMAMQAESGQGPLVELIRHEVSGLLAEDPGLALAVARHFGRRADWSQMEGLGRLMDSGVISDPETRYEVDQYLAAATEALFWENN